MRDEGAAPYDGADVPGPDLPGPADSGEVEEAILELCLDGDSPARVTILFNALNKEIPHAKTWVRQLVVKPGCVDHPVSFPAGRLLRFSLRSPDAKGSMPMTPIAAGERARIALSQSSKCRLSLRLVGPNGADRGRSVTVDVVELHNGGRLRLPVDQLKAATDADGRLEIEGQCGAQVNISADDAQIEGGQVVARMLLDGADWSLTTEPLWDVRLTVRDEEGRHVRGAKLLLGGEDAGQDIPKRGLLLHDWAREQLARIEAPERAVIHWSPARSDLLQQDDHGVWNAVVVLGDDPARSTRHIDLDPLLPAGAPLLVVDTDSLRACPEASPGQRRCELGGATQAIALLEHDVARAWEPNQAPALVRPSIPLRACLDLASLPCGTDGLDVVSVHPAPARIHSALGPVERQTGPEPLCLSVPEGQALVVTCGIDADRRWAWLPPADPEPLR